MSAIALESKLEVSLRCAGLVIAVGAVLAFAFVAGLL